ncbi:PadR family transcriptional regulator [Paenibacillus ginsengarvi]|uniref:PadR family transcriptional regulator n=1 Tax=Paenibacillus ginsengarvi TaxID=400777 RepID=A0A3B0CPH7_9BACL|nr:PadR family transcriptional regulator [Paenibacillus ginsengarvi]RKN86610.1 PadR family transcriptional regulator [Paenibacillus ginsengarvi]
MSSVRLLVLGSILRSGASHGYKVYSDITSWRADTWTNVKPGSIYHALEKLESQRLIQPVPSQSEEKPGPSRTEYSVSEKGKEEFYSLLEAALKSSDIQSFSVGVAFMEMMPRTEVLALLQERHTLLLHSAQFLKSLPTSEFPSDPSKHPELVGLWVRYVESQAEHTLRMLQHIESGQYGFREHHVKEENE